MSPKTKQPQSTEGNLGDESILTGFGAVVGTLEYMSPEQAGFAGLDIDTRADIYSLGVTVVEQLLVKNSQADPQLRTGKVYTRVTGQSLRTILADSFGKTINQLRGSS